MFWPGISVGGNQTNHWQIGSIVLLRREKKKKRKQKTMAATRSNPSVMTDGLPDASAEPLSVVESPASGTALARFEFETGKGNEGTKILMVEWDAASTAMGSRQMEDWQVSWEGKTTVLPIRDPELSEGGSSNRRVYFLLPPGAPIPPLVTISRTGAGATSDPLRTKPLPAIFHPALLGAETKQEVGLRGVLHTIWAKKRLVELQAEMDREAKSNGESVGLEMALQERNWIVEHFGLSESYAPKQQQAVPLSPTSPTSPRSPIGGKLGEKLKGLKLATSPTELAAASQRKFCEHLWNIKAENNRIHADRDILDCLLLP